MKNHIVFKFIAILLCAASLMGAVGGALGILALTERGLYRQSVEEAYDDFVETHASALAAEIAERYASMNLGGANSQLADSIHGNYWSDQFFYMNRISYTIFDSTGAELQSQQMEDTPVSHFSFPLGSIRYIRVLSETPEDIYNQKNLPEIPQGVTTQIGDDYVYNAIPENGAEVYFIQVQFADGSGWGVGSPDEPMGFLTQYGDGTVEFLPTDDYGPMEDAVVTGIQFLDRNNTSIYEAYSPSGVLAAYGWQENTGFTLQLRDLTETVMTIDAIPMGGCAVTRVFVAYADGFEESIGGTPDIGFLDYDEEGRVRFVPYDAGVFTYHDAPVIHIAFYDDANNEMVYEARDPDGVGWFFYQGEELLFLADRNIKTGEDSMEDAEEPATKMGARAVVLRKTPIWILFDGEFEKQGYYYGKEYDVTIYATMVRDGRLFGCTTSTYLTVPEYPSEWVELEDVEIVTHAVSGNDRGRPALCNTDTKIWALEDGECYDTNLSYQEGQQINILVLGNFDSGEWGLTDMGWVKLEDIAWLEESDTQTAAAVPEETAIPATEAPLMEESSQAEIQQDLDIRSAPDSSADVVGTFHRGDIVHVIRTVTTGGVKWALTDQGWVTVDQLVQVDLPVMEFDLTSIEETIEPDEETIPNMTEIADSTAEDTFPNDTVEESVPRETGTGAAVPEVEPIEPFLIDGELETVPGEDIRVYGYWDHVTQQRMIVEYVYEDIPNWTVQIDLAEGAIQTESSWIIARLLYACRNQLPYLLAVCLLLFAILAVYLCCAAGKHPGSTEIRAGGLNRIPLDMYAVAAVGGVAAMAVLALEGGQYLLQSNIQVGMLAVGLCAYGASLLVVGFCFACAAQFKTPGRFWWHNSLCGFCLRLTGKLCKWLLKFAVWAAKKAETGLWPWLVRLCGGIFKVVKMLLKKLCRWLQLLVIWLQRCGDWMWKKLSRFFSMLPLIWQWLLTGFILVFLLYVALRSYKVGWILLGFGLFFAVILYAASAFGILLENAKRMSKGDLDSKVEDKMLLGGFKDFAGELNGLADVAVVAAQKQLKSERMKTELITNVSHDIKTPLTSIINYVDLLQKPHTQAQQEQYLAVLDRQSQRLKKLIDDLMEMSKASTGNLAVDVTRVDAAEAVNQALGEFADKLERAQLFPVFRQPEETVYMMADGRLVWRVMSNLLSNAVKYALPGTRVYVDLQKLDNKVIISMKNISREELNVEADELLERFVRGDTSRNTEGSGLGLNIAQSLMELQKGQLQILVDGDLFKVTLIFPGVE